jgi:hypothetical protein
MSHLQESLDSDSQPFPSSKPNPGQMKVSDFDYEEAKKENFYEFD